VPLQAHLSVHASLEHAGGCHGAPRGPRPRMRRYCRPPLAAAPKGRPPGEKDRAVPQRWHSCPRRGLWRDSYWLPFAGLQ
jgi:hypothetical protein